MTSNPQGVYLFRPVDSERWTIDSGLIQDLPERKSCFGEEKLKNKTIRLSLKTIQSLMDYNLSNNLRVLVGARVQTKDPPLIAEPLSTPSV